MGEELPDLWGEQDLLLLWWLEDWWQFLVTRGLLLWARGALILRLLSECEEDDLLFFEELFEWAEEHFLHLVMPACFGPLRAGPNDTPILPFVPTSHFLHPFTACPLTGRPNLLFRLDFDDREDLEDPFLLEHEGLVPGRPLETLLWCLFLLRTWDFLLDFEGLVPTRPLEEADLRLWFLPLSFSLHECLGLEDRDGLVPILPLDFLRGYLRFFLTFLQALFDLEEGLVPTRPLLFEDELFRLFDTCFFFFLFLHLRAGAVPKLFSEWLLLLTTLPFFTLSLSHFLHSFLRHLTEPLSFRRWWVTFLLTALRIVPFNPPPSLPPLLLSIWLAQVLALD